MLDVVVVWCRGRWCCFIHRCKDVGWVKCPDPLANGVQGPLHPGVTPSSTAGRPVGPEAESRCEAYTVYQINLVSPEDVSKKLHLLTLNQLRNGTGVSPLPDFFICHRRE